MNKNNFVEYWLKLNELPNSKVIFVWLSYKLDKNGKILEAFCESTNSWKIISKLEEWCKWINIYKTNLVKWVPLKDGKIRYPNVDEKKDWLQKLLGEISVVNPKVVYLFWKQVSDYIIKHLDLERISDLEYKFWNVTFVYAHHPSYIYIYKRKEIDNYVWGITSKMFEIIEN